MTPTSQLHQLPRGRELHYTEWGAAHDEAVIAWHGLARTGRDMDDIAAHLAQRYRVICPDTIGRGLSQWSPQPAQEYCLAFYAQLAAALVDQLGLERVHWLGTSMGGAIGLKAAAGPLRGRIRRMVLNDVGPQLADAAIQRIRSYAGSPPAFATVSELEQYFRTVYKPYGAMSDAQWRRLTETSDAPPARRPRDVTTASWLFLAFLLVAETCGKEQLERPGVVPAAKCAAAGATEQISAPGGCGRRCQPGSVARFGRCRSQPHRQR